MVELKMKKEMKRTIIFSMLVGALALSVTSCKIDNFPAPDSTFSGKVIDSYTGQPILASQEHGHIRFWETSFSTNPSEITIPLKQDGTYSNNKLFPATIDVVPIGAWWPADTLRDVTLGKNLTKDFEVTPFLVLSDFKATLKYDAQEIIGTTTYAAGWYIYMSCVLDAPLKEKAIPGSSVPMALPNIMEVRPFLSRTKWCGPGKDSNIGFYGNNRYYQIWNRSWDDIVADEDTELTADGKIIVNLPKIDVKDGYTYWIRMGSKVRDTQENYALTEIQRIEVPVRQN